MSDQGPLATTRVPAVPLLKQGGAEDLKKAAREMESLFLYELIKVMRESAGTGERTGLGKSVHLGMFDAELARLMSSRGTGFQEVILRGLEKGTRPAADAAEAYRQQPPGTDGGKTESLMARMLPGAQSARISSLPGYRRDPIDNGLRLHRGLDIAVPEDTEIRPPWKGRVVFSGERPGYGNMVEIDHGGGFVTAYGHTKENLVREGDSVGPETVIARSGTTGRSSGPHVHVEFRSGGASLDPLPLLLEKRD